MNRQTIEERFVSEITRGLWLAPGRKREIEREALDHLEDVAEEHGIAHWTEERLREHFGSAKQLGPLFAKGGLPMWAKIMNWGLRGLVGAVILAIVLNFWVLWFHSVPQLWLDLSRAEHPITQSIMRDEPTSGIQWLEPGDTVAEATLERFEACMDIIERQQQRFLGPHPSPVDYSELEFMLPEEHERLIELWSGVPENARLRLRRPTVTEDDFREFERYPTMTEEEQRERLQPRRLQYDWLRMAHGIHEVYPSFTVEEAIQRAKEMMAFAEYNHMNINHLHFYLAYGAASKYDYSAVTPQLPPGGAGMYGGGMYGMGMGGGVGGEPVLRPMVLDSEENVRVAKATARWNRLILEALNPNPEPLIDLLYMVAFTGRTFEMIEEGVEKLDDLAVYESPLREYVKVNFGEAEEGFRLLEEIVAEQDQDMEFRTIDIPAAGLSRAGLFRWQCRLMQRFSAPGSDAYYRYDILARMWQLPQASIMIPSLLQASMRMKEAQAKQALAQGALELIEHLQAGRSLGAFSPKAIDSYTDEPIRFEHDSESVRFASTGPSGQFDDTTYSPRGGMYSDGDIEWVIQR